MKKIIPLIYGKSVLSENMIFQNGSKDKFRPIVFMIYLIKTEDKLILIDAGCETMPGFVMSDFIGPVAALEMLNIKPDDITDVIITHSHHDHIECVNKFKNAAIYIQSEEYESGKEYFDSDNKPNLFDDELEIYPGIRAIKIGGHSTGSSIVEIEDSKCKYIIAGDECYIRECLDKQIPTGTSCNIQKSRGFIEKYTKDGYTVLLCHDSFKHSEPIIIS